MNELIAMAIVCGTLVLLAAMGAVFYLASRLVDTNRHLLGQNANTMRHALAINEDCREFERIRNESDLKPRATPRIPAAAFRQEQESLPVDGQIPIGENGEMNYTQFERGG